MSKLIRGEKEGNLKYGWLGIHLWRLYIGAGWRVPFPFIGAYLTITPQSVGLHLGLLFLQPVVSVKTWSTPPDEQPQIETFFLSRGPLYIKLIASENKVGFGAAIQMNEYSIYLDIPLAFFAINVGIRLKDAK